jgi:hypothetical protein
MCHKQHDAQSNSRKSICASQPHNCRKNAADENSEALDNQVRLKECRDYRTQGRA